MRTQSKFLIPLLFTTILLLVTACGPTGTPDAVATFNPMVTAAAQTMEALLTQAANQPGAQPSDAQPTATQTGEVIILPTLTLEPTSTSFVLSTVTPFPTSTPPAPTAITRCDWISFVSDVSVPDGTKYAPGASFVKTWRLKNIGTCAWTSSYSLVFVSGDQMGGAAAIALTGNVAPNQTVDVSVTLTAPATEKAYTGYWMLKNASGAMFGFGPTASSKFWVNIVVSNPAITAPFYDFVENYLSADWVCGGTTTSACIKGSSGDTATGFVTKLPSPKIESNTAVFEAGLWTRPKGETDGYITGTYPVIKIQSGDRFQAKVGCQYGATASGCLVGFRLEYYLEGDPSNVKKLWEWDEKYEGNFKSVNVDLTSLAGKSVVFILKVKALGIPTDDDAIWSGARIMRTTPLSTTGTCSYTVDPAINFPYAPNTPGYDITWTIKNTSSENWDLGTVDYIWQAGNLHTATTPLTQDVPVIVAKNDTVTLKIDMLTPTTPGLHSEVWIVKRTAGPTLCTMTATIKVVAP